MKVVSIQDLKQRLSALISEAASGAHILITRHRKPVARLEPARHRHLRVGTRFGRTKLTPALRSPTKGRYLEVLEEDRRGGGSKN